MGFWNGFMKVVQGKPVFEVSETKSLTGTSTEKIDARPTKTAIDGSGHKMIPEVSFEHCETHINGLKMGVTVWVTNRSSVQIELDKIVMLGMTTELDRFLEPGEAHELRLYEGEIAKNSSYHTANLYYKQVSSGDYFCADFMIEYDYDSRGFYTVDELHPIHPVKDV